MNVCESYLKAIQNPVKTFDDVQALFVKNADEITWQKDAVVKIVREELDAIIKIPAQNRTFDNTARALDSAFAMLGIATGAFDVQELTSPDKKIREAAHAGAIAMKQFFVDAFNDVNLYRAFKEYVDFKNKTKEHLSQEQKYFLQETMRDFKRSGLDLPADKLAEVKSLKKLESEIKSKFEFNIACDTKKLTFDKHELPGLDETFLKTLTKTKEGKYLVGCDVPTYLEIMEHCSQAKTREKLCVSFNTRAYPNNLKILHDLIAVRDQLAKALGFESFSAYEYDVAMAKTVDIVDNFLHELYERTPEKVRQEVKNLKKELPAGVLLHEGAKFYPWDRWYVQEWYKKKHFDIDNRYIAEFFPVEKTLTGIFDIYQKFLGVHFTIFTPSWAWHPDVRVIEVRSGDKKSLFGYIALDLYPRDGKYTHACVAPVIPSTQRAPGLMIMIANFPRASKERPALLKFENVKTFFHEFGHAMHGILGATDLASLSGLSVKVDFVEVPSQMFEEWLYEKDILACVSSHYKTGEPLPDEIIEKLLELKRFDAGCMLQRQLSFAILSLKLFESGASKDSDALVSEIVNKYIHFSVHDERTHFQTSFGHLGGYGAKYYSYLWSQVYALDLFAEIKKEGLLDSAVGRRLIDKILSKGGGAEPMDLLKDFLGRAPTQDAFLHDLGIE